MMFRTKEDAKKELQEKILILDSNYKLALKNLKNSITYQKLCIVCSKVMFLKVNGARGEGEKRLCSNTCRSRYNRNKNKYKT
tara:strand:- start:72 stop:317 length:246 start_codon:yes stop_codon:yes gene_type:complete